MTLMTRMPYSAVRSGSSLIMSCRARKSRITSISTDITARVIFILPKYIIKTKPTMEFTEYIIRIYFEGDGVSTYPV